MSILYNMFVTCQILLSSWVRTFSTTNISLQYNSLSLSSFFALGGMKRSKGKDAMGLCALRHKTRIGPEIGVRSVTCIISASIGFWLACILVGTYKTVGRNIKRLYKVITKIRKQIIIT